MGEKVAPKPFTSNRQFQLKDAENTPILSMRRELPDWGDHGYVQVTVRWLVPWPAYVRRAKILSECSFRISCREMSYPDVVRKVFHDWHVEVPPSILERVRRNAQVYKAAVQQKQQYGTTHLKRLYNKVYGAKESPSREKSGKET